MQRPSIGRVIVVKGMSSNGQDEHPAIVNCVHGNDHIGPDVWLLNATMFPDNDSSRNVLSLNMFDTRELAIKWRNDQGDTHPLVAFWPERV